MDEKYASELSSLFLEDIEWSNIMLMNSMDEVLQDSANATLEESYPVSQHGGPLTFALMFVVVVVVVVVNSRVPSLSSIVGHCC